MKLELDELISRVSPIIQQALERASEHCIINTQYNVEIEHLLYALLENQDSEFFYLFQTYHIDIASFSQGLLQEMEQFKRGCTRTPTLSNHLLDLLQEAYFGTLIYSESKQIHSSAIFWSIFENRNFRQLLHKAAKELDRLINPPDFQTIQHLLSQQSHSTTSEVDSAVAPAFPNRENHSTPYLDQYTLNLTEQARAGKIDPIQGRDREIRQMMDILMRRRQNNPILTGDAGVGKTAVVEGLALKIAQGEVPAVLQEVSIHTLDLGLLQAGTSLQGEFEKRLKAIIQEITHAKTSIILFIDEAHTLIGAGGREGQGDAANLLKPALARGELKTIGATTYAEYKKYFEKDPALVRRFQVIQVEEPSEEQALQMLRGLKPYLESHHQIQILEEAMQEAVKLSHRYITGRKLPDKAISILDTACARVALSQATLPASMESIQSAIFQNEQELRILEQEATLHSHLPRIKELKKETKSLHQQLKKVEQRWKKEKEYVSQISLLTSKTEKKKRQKIRTQLKKIQAGEPHIFEHVDSRVVAEIVAHWTGIPVGKMQQEDIEKILELSTNMQTRLIGQKHAIAMISKRIQTSKAGLEDPQRPIGIFLLAGPSGVGKTETALVVAELLYGGEQNLITINMSEYQEAHTVSALKGAPPGYVGYGQGGILTEAVRRNPYSVILLDEIEKAHSDVLELFYQVFDKGTLEDAEGISVNFKNTLLFLTTNVGAETLHSQRNAIINGTVEWQEVITADLQKAFPAAFLGRLISIPYLPLQEEEIRQIVVLKIQKIKTRFLQKYHRDLVITPEVEDFISQHCLHSGMGARMIDQLLTNTILPGLAERLLEQMRDQNRVTSARVFVSSGEHITYEIE